MASGKREKSAEAMKSAVIAKLAMIAKQKPADSKPQVISTRAMGEMVDKIEAKNPGWLKRTAHLEKGRTYQSALQQARNHDIDVSCLTQEKTEKKNSDKNSKKRGEEGE